MSPRDRRVAIPVPVQHKPSIWKTLRHKIRAPLRRFAHAEDRNPDETEPSYDSPFGQRDVDLDIAYSQSRQQQQQQSPKKVGRKFDSPFGRRTSKDRDRHKSSGRTKPTEAEISRVMSDPEMSRRAVASQYSRQHESQYYDSPYHEQDLANLHESPYISPRTDQRYQQSWGQQWHTRQYGYAMAPQARTFQDYDDARRYYQPAAMDYYQNPYFQQDAGVPYFEYPDQRGFPNRPKRNKKQSKKEKKRRSREHVIKICDDQCMAPKVGCVVSPDVFSSDTMSMDTRDEETDLSASWIGGSMEQEKTKLKKPGVLEATILQNYTDNTLDASALEAEAHNAVLQLSNKVRTELRHSAEEVGAAFTKATDAFLLGNPKNHRHRRRSQGRSNDIISERYDKYFNKFAEYDSLYDDAVTDGVTDVEDETMASDAHDFSSSEEIEMTWPQWRQVTYGALSFGRHKS